MDCLKTSISFLDLLDLGKVRQEKHHVYVNPLYEEKRNAYVDGLHNTWKLVSRVEDPYLCRASFATYGIKCHNLLQESSFDEVPNAPKFFRKMPHEKLQEYPVDRSDEETMGWIRGRKAFWGQTEKAYQGLRPIKQAAMMCTAMRLAFDGYKRKTSDGQQVTLRQMTGWKEADFAFGILHSVFYDEILHCKHWYPGDAWQSGKPKDQPHVMLTLAHEHEGNDNSLLRGEVLAIMATMLTRLESDSFKQHNIIPVMVLSFTAERKGRVLQAYFADDGLVIYKSRLFSFEGVRDGETSAEFFLEYMGSEMVGDTAVTKTASIV